MLLFFEALNCDKLETSSCERDWLVILNIWNVNLFIRGICVN